MKRSSVQEIGATLAHRLAIEELNAFVAACLDEQRYDDLAQAFTEDARYTSGARFLSGPGEIARFFVERKAAGGPRITRHAGTGLRLEFNHDHTEARGSSVWVSYASNTPDVPVDHVAVFMVADFEDVYVLQGEGYWRIRERVIRPVFRNAAAAPRA